MTMIVSTWTTGLADGDGQLPLEPLEFSLG